MANLPKIPRSSKKFPELSVFMEALLGLRYIDRNRQDKFDSVELTEPVELFMALGDTDGLSSLGDTDLCNEFSPFF
jgi:hypothetical protein